MYTDAKTVEYEALVRHEAERTMRGAEPINRPCLLDLQIIVAVPKSYTKSKRAQALAGDMHPTTGFDADNVAKAVCDAFNGVVWTDDVLVTDLIVRKRFGEQPYIQASVTPLNRLRC